MAAAKVVQIEGDPDSPVSRGRLCPKGSASLQLTTGGAREYKVKYRRPFVEEWVDLDLDTAMDMIVVVGGAGPRLGRPARFLNMLRVFKVTSPMSVGSWILSGYVPAAGAAAWCALSGRMPRLGAAATAGAALLGPAVASYTAALVSDTAVPAWHDGYREMPFVFVGSGAMAAGGLGMLAGLLPGAPPDESVPARNLALLGAGMETAALERMERRMGMVAEPYSEGKSGMYIKAGKALAALGTAGALLSTRSRVAAAMSGTAMLAASVATRWGIFHAGLASAADPKYTVIPQRERLKERQLAEGVSGTVRSPD